MVQFVFTPWRNRAELLRVRAQLYPYAAASTTGAASVSTPTPPWWSSPDELRDIERAIARVFMWVQRGGCPHVVESTALLMSAIVFDARGGHDAVAGAGVTAGYLVGFTRFVTGLLDSHQDKARKLSMYGVAKTIGLPASFVELRHQGTHEPMPSLGQLRPAARRALVWIWEYYWKNLPDEDVPGGVAGGDGSTAARGEGEGEVVQNNNGLEERMCRRALLGYLLRQEGEVGEEAAREGLMRQLKRWNDVLVLRTLADVGGSARDGGMLVRAVKLSSTIRGLPAGTNGEEAGEREQDGEELKKELCRARDEAESASEGAGSGKMTGKRKKAGDDDGPEDGDRKRGGWFKWEGSWSQKPIGVL